MPICEQFAGMGTGASGIGELIRRSAAILRRHFGWRHGFHRGGAEGVGIFDFRLGAAAPVRRRERKLLQSKIENRKSKICRGRANLKRAACRRRAGGFTAH
jgi:hypothetical protein